MGALTLSLGASSMQHGLLRVTPVTQRTLHHPPPQTHHADDAKAMMDVPILSAALHWLVEHLAPPDAARLTTILPPVTEDPACRFALACTTPGAATVFLAPALAAAAADNPCHVYHAALCVYYVLLCHAGVPASQAVLDVRAAEASASPVPSGSSIPSLDPAGLWQLLCTRSLVDDKRAAAWYVACVQLDAEVDLHAAAAILDASNVSPDVQAQHLLDTLRADPAVERRNALLLESLLREQGVALTVSRFGRASYFMTMLASASVAVAGAGSEVLQVISEVLDAVDVPATLPAEKNPLAARMQHELVLFARRLAGLVTDLRTVLVDKASSRARLMGVVMTMSQTLQRGHADTIAKYQDAMAIAGRDLDTAAVTRVHEHLDALVAGVRRATLKLQALVHQLHGPALNFSVLVQRASITGVRALNMLRLGRDPFDSGEELIAEIQRDGAHAMYATSGSVWFDVAHYWVEALPLFIHESGERVIIEQEGMELALRRLAVNWKRNIDTVMDSEHVDLARRLLTGVEDSGEALRVARDRMRCDPGFEQLVCAAAALVAHVWRQQRHAVAQRMREAAESSAPVERSAALAAVMSQHLPAVLQPQQDAVTYDALERELAAADSAAASSAFVVRAGDEAQRLVDTGAAWAKVRTTPTWIVLTTQAPGMSDAFAGHWVDEEMALAAVMTSFQYNGVLLDDEAKAVMMDVEDDIKAVAMRVLREFGLSSSPATVTSQLRSYSDVAEETCRAYFLWDLVAAGDDAVDDDDASARRTRLARADPPAVSAYIAQHRTTLLQTAAARVIADNAEVAAETTVHQLKDNPVYASELERNVVSAARLAVLQQQSDVSSEMLAWYTSSDDGARMPPLLRLRLSSEKGLTTARQQVASAYVVSSDLHTLRHVQEISDADVQAAAYLPLILLLNDPLFAYECRGGAKKYNRGYGPSRVDLGKRERVTTEGYAQWIGPADMHAKHAMVRFYRTYNFDVRAFDDIRSGEEMKPLENSLMEASLAVSQTFIPLFQAIGAGNMIKMMYETNQRPEVFVRAGGAGSAGFCQPKDIYYLPFVNAALFDEVLGYAGMPANTWPGMAETMERVFARTGRDARLDQLRQCVMASIRQPCTSRNFLLDARPAVNIAQVSAMEAFARIGLGRPGFDARRFASTLVAQWHGQVLATLEATVRFAPVHALFLLRSGFQDAAETRRETMPAAASWDRAIVALPVEYKPVSDARLSVGLRMFEFLAGTAAHLTHTFGPEGAALSRLLLYGLDASKDDALLRVLSQRLAGSAALTDALSTQQVAQLAAAYPLVHGPADVRLVSPFNLASSAIFGYLSGNSLAQVASEVRRTLVSRSGLTDDVIDANALTHGGDLAAWDGVSDSARVELIASIGRRIHALVAEVRQRDPAYRASAGSDLWESMRGSDVFTTLVHYPELTGSEDAGVEAAPDQAARVIDDLPRVRQTMLDGRAHSALIWFDAPIQGRKPAADPLSMRRWLALGGWYVCPTVAPSEVRRALRDVRADAAAMARVETALLQHDWHGAEAAFADHFARVAADRYQEARLDEAVAVDAARWWRGGGHLNWSPRHRVYAEAWSKVCLGLPLFRIDLASLLLLGLAYLLDGLPAEQLRGRLTALADAQKAWHRDALRTPYHGPKGVDPLPSSILEYVLRADAGFVSPGFVELRGDAQHLVKGESISLKRREDDAERAAGRALANWTARQAEAAAHARVSGYQAARQGIAAAASPPDFATAHGTAMQQLGQVGDVVSTEQVGAFLAWMQAAADAKGIDVSALATDPSQETWVAVVGAKDDEGAIGRAALAAAGDASLLQQLAQLGGLLDIALALILTHEYHAMSSETLMRLGGAAAVSDRVAQAVALFFSRTVYDHSFDYFPMWMHPAKAGNGFTNYDTIMGNWLGEGTPLTRQQVLALAVQTHRWLSSYMFHLLRHRTRLALLSDADAALVLGTADVTPIGVACDWLTETERDWWTYTQRRELAFLMQQGHEIALVAADLDADDVLDAVHRTNVCMTCPVGRPHLTCLLKEAAQYNAEHEDAPINVVISRAYQFQDRAYTAAAGGSERVMTVPNGYVYLDADSFVKAGGDADTAAAEVARTGKGVLVAAVFRRSIVNHVSVPFHGAPYYQAGEDESIGLPSMQSWIHNLVPGYSKSVEHQVYAGSGLYPAEVQWYQRQQYTASGADRLPFDSVCDALAQTLRGLPWWRVIAKPSKQSGGRGTVPGRIRDAEGVLQEQLVQQLVREIAPQTYLDDVVLQRLVSSSPYMYASPTLVAEIRRAMIPRGVAMPRGAPLFSYSRIITVDTGSGVADDGNSDEPECVLELVVTSRMAVSNVGLGGVLFKWRPEFASSPALAEQLSAERRRNALESLPRIQATAQQYWGLINAKHSELEPALQRMQPRLARAHTDGNNVPCDRSGRPYAKPRLLMHDLLDVPVVRLGDRILVGPDIVDVALHADGSLARFVVLVDSGDGDGAWRAVPCTPDVIVGWRAIKIEDNIGYGLWQPFDQDELRLERAAAATEGRPVDHSRTGAELRRIMHAFAVAGHEYRAAIGAELVSSVSAPATASGGMRSQPAPEAKAVPPPVPDPVLVTTTNALSVVPAIAADRAAASVASGDLAARVAAARRAARALLTQASDVPAFIAYAAEVAAADAVYTHTALSFVEAADDAVADAHPVFLVVVQDCLGAVAEAHALALTRRDAGVPGAVVVVPVDWLEPWLAPASARAQRHGFVISLDATDASKDAVMVAKLGAGVVVDAAYITSLTGRAEHEAHAVLTRRLCAGGISVTGAGGVGTAAALADDKLAAAVAMQWLVHDVPATSELSSWSAKQHRGTVRTLPRYGTNGCGHRVHTSGAAAAATAAMSSASEALVVRSEVGNVRYQGTRRITLRVLVTHAWPGRYHAQRAFWQVAASPRDLVANASAVPLADGDAALSLADTGVAVIWDADADARACAQAVAAVEAVNLAVAPSKQLRLAGVDIELQASEDGQTITHMWLLEVNARPTGLVHCPRDKQLWSLFWHALPVSTGSAADMMHELALSDVDESPAALLDDLTAASSSPSLPLDAACAIVTRLARSVTDDAAAPASNALLLHQRAILVAGDVLYRLDVAQRREAAHRLRSELCALQGNDNEEADGASLTRALTNPPPAHLPPHAQRMVFLNAFLAAANAREVADYTQAAAALQAQLLQQRADGSSLRYTGPALGQGVFVSRSGMRLGISSANASDNWTSAKLRGGVALNVAVNLNDAPPVRVELSLLPHPVLVLTTSLAPHASLTLYTPEDFAHRVYHDVQDSSDPVRFLRYALQFVGILPPPSKRKAAHAAFLAFTGGAGLRISVHNTGPSRSGFASSSVVAMNLLNALYRCSGQASVLDADALALGSLALLFENQLGLKSGRQDVDGVLAGVKVLRYPPSTGFLTPVMPVGVAWTAAMQRVWRRLVVVSTGIQRTAVTDWRRGLNARHLVYLLRDAGAFRALRQSYPLHKRIVDAFTAGDAAALGNLFNHYLQLRCAIDPGAVESVYDAAAGGVRVLLHLFQHCSDQGLIHGGMYTGAMGGGVALLVATSDDVAPLHRAVLQLRDQYILGDGQQPFQHLTILDCSVNHVGVETTCVQQPS